MKTICDCCGKEYEVKEGDRRHYFYWDTQGKHCNHELMEDLR